MRPGLADVLNSLKQKGYTVDFNLLQNKPDKNFSKDYKVDEVYRFDEATDPDDQAVLYAISSRQGDKKGVLVNGFGIYSDQITNDMIDEVGRRTM